MTNFTLVIEWALTNWPLEKRLAFPDWSAISIPTFWFKGNLVLLILIFDLPWIFLSFIIYGQYNSATRVKLLVRSEHESYPFWVRSVVVLHVPYMFCPFPGFFFDTVLSFRLLWSRAFIVSVFVLGLTRIMALFYLVRLEYSAFNDRASLDQYTPGPAQLPSALPTNSDNK